MIRLTVREAASVPAAFHPDDPADEDGTLVVVDLGSGRHASDDEIERAAANLRAGDRVVVGTGTPEGRAARLLDRLAFTLHDEAPDQRFVAVSDMEAELTALAGAVAGNPVASSVLTDVLRVTERTDVREGLRVESFAYSTLLAGPEFRAWRKAQPARRRGESGRVPVRAERTGGRLDIQLDDPSRRNAYSAAMRDGLVEALTVAVLDPGVSEVTLAGRGPAFCSGGDLTEFGTGPDVASAHVLRTRQSPGALLAALSSRVRVRLHGACVGAGIELPAFAGTVTAAPDVAIRLPEIAMGLIPGAGGTVSITRRIGRWRTAYLALSGRSIDACTARDWHLVDELEERS